MKNLQMRIKEIGKFKVKSLKEFDELTEALRRKLE